MSDNIWVGEGEAPGDGYPPVSGGLACQWYPWNVRECESAETWADVWAALAGRRASKRAAKWSNGPGFQRIGGCAGGVPAWRLFDPQPAAAVAGRALQSRAADGVSLTAHAVHGWQVVGGVTAARLMAAGRPGARHRGAWGRAHADAMAAAQGSLSLAAPHAYAWANYRHETAMYARLGDRYAGRDGRSSERDDDATVCVTPAGLAALDRHRVRENERLRSTLAELVEAHDAPPWGDGEDPHYEKAVALGRRLDAAWARAREALDGRYSTCPRGV